MTLVSNPNGLLVASALFALAGLAVLARAFFTAYAAPAHSDDKAQQKNQAKVALLFGMPMLAAGLFLNAAGQFATGPMGAGLTCLLLALAFTLLVYAMMESSLADEMASLEQRAVVSETARRPVAQPPKLIAVEARDDDVAAAETPRQALPA